MWATGWLLFVVSGCSLRKVPGNFEHMGHRMAHANSEIIIASGLLVTGHDALTEFQLLLRF
jgi:hypothetical protein